RQRHRDLHLAAFAVREVRDDAALPRFQTHLAKSVARRLQDGFVARCGAKEAERTGEPGLRRQAAVLEHGELREDIRLLVAAAHAALRYSFGRLAADFLAVEHDAPCARDDVAAQQVDERALARAVRSNDRVHLAHRHRERYAIDGLQPTETAR